MTICPCVSKLRYFYDYGTARVELLCACVAIVSVRVQTLVACIWRSASTVSPGAEACSRILNHRQCEIGLTGPALDGSVPAGRVQADVYSSTNSGTVTLHTAKMLTVITCTKGRVQTVSELVWGLKICCFMRLCQLLANMAQSRLKTTQKLGHCEILGPTELRLTQFLSVFINAQFATLLVISLRPVHGSAGKNSSLLRRFYKLFQFHSFCRLVR